MKRNLSPLLLVLALVGAGVAWQALGCDVNLKSPDQQTDLTWFNFGGAFFDTYCVGCHTSGGEGGFSLEAYSRVVAKKDEIRGEVDSRAMPPEDYSIKPTDGDISRLLEWLDADAPEGKATYANYAKAVIDQYCATCHNDAPPAGYEDVPMSLTTYAELKPHLEHIQEELASRGMPPENFATRPSEVQYDSLLTWIKQGAAEK